jgi:DNA-binding response OmpR family regulator
MAKRILVIEDNPRVLAVVRKRLETSGYQVITAQDGIEGLELAKSSKPDRIVLDVMLPEKDGFEVCRELKDDAAYKRIPILLLTVRSQTRDVERGMRSGADAYLTKPFDGGVLLKRIAELLDKVAQETRTNETTDEHIKKGEGRKDEG